MLWKSAEDVVESWELDSFSFQVIIHVEAVKKKKPLLKKKEGEKKGFKMYLS